MNRLLAGKERNAVGLGCMNLSHAYGVPPDKSDAIKVLEAALDIGVDHFDSAALYGFGRNEELVGPFLKAHRDRVLLVSKGGARGVNGVREIDARPEVLQKDLEESLKRLDTDVIDLYYLHRCDKVTLIEESIGALSRFVEQGKVRMLGVSEVSAETLRKAHATHPISAVQSEYSLWSRNVEIAVLDACEELGIPFVAFSPLARGFLTDVDLVPKAFAEKDIRRRMPRFQPEHFVENTKWLARFRELANEAGCTPAQLALGWVLAQKPFIHVVPGTTSVDHLLENVAVSEVALNKDLLDQAARIVDVSGPRYPAATQAEIDTEEFD